MADGAEQDVDGRAAGAAPEPEGASKPGAGPAGRARSERKDEHVAAGEFAVRPAAAFDARPLAALWAEMQRHYGQPVSESSAAAAAAVACRAGPARGFDPRVLVAVADTGSVVGAVVLNVTFPASGLTRSLYIRDMYVAGVARRRGVARSLLRAAAALALSEGFSSLDWTAEAGNAGARRFYEGAGAALVDRVYFRLCGSSLRRAAEA